MEAIQIFAKLYLSSYLENNSLIQYKIYIERRLCIVYYRRQERPSSLAKNINYQNLQIL